LHLDGLDTGLTALIERKRRVLRSASISWTTWFAASIAPYTTKYPSGPRSRVSLQTSGASAYRMLTWGLFEVDYEGELDGNCLNLSIW
jgi:hypothetical protein